MIGTLGGLVAFAITAPAWYAYHLYRLKGRVRTLLLDRIRARGLTISTGDDAVRVPKTALVPGGAGPIRWSVEVPGSPAVSVYQPQYGNTVFGWKSSHQFDASFSLGPNHEVRFRSSEAGPWIDSTQLVATFAKTFPGHVWQLVYENGYFYLYAHRAGTADLAGVLRGVPVLETALGTPARKRGRELR